MKGRVGNPFLRIDRARCLSCAACVAVCGEQSLLIHGLDLHFSPGTCTSCAECFRVCPTAAVVPIRGHYYRGIE